MKRSKLCGLLLVLFTIFGLSLNINLKDSSALKYDVQSIPLYFPSGFYAGTSSSTPSSSDTFSFSVEGDVDLHFDDSSYQYVLGMKNQDGTCLGHKYVSLPFRSYNSSLNTTSYSFGFLGISPSFSQTQFWSNFNPCLSIDELESFDGQSVASLAPNIGNPTPSQLTSLLPYRFNYSGFYRTDSMRDNGLYFDSKFDLHNIFGSSGYPDKITDLNIPFSPQSSVSSTFYNGMPIKFDGEFVIDPDDRSLPFGLSSNTTFNLQPYYIYGGSVVKPSSTSCNWSLNLDNPDDPNSVYSLKYSCPYVLGSDVSSYDPSTQVLFFRLQIHFDYSSSITKFFLFIFDSSFVISDNNYEFGGYFDSPVQGANPHSAPGSVYQNDYNDSDLEPNYERSLSNLFDFSFVNPFSNIFNLFTDNSSCASIPTLAGMLHSEETTVCPWFNSNIRSILTPVFGFVSMMLLVGFAVRWLGSSSGNMFEDQTSHKWDNTQFKQRGKH